MDKNHRMNTEPPYCIVVLVFETPLLDQARKNVLQRNRVPRGH